MKRGWKLFTAALGALLLLTAALLLTVTHWLPRLAAAWLPAGTTLSFDGNLHWRNSGLALPGLHYRVGDCELVAVSDLTLQRASGRWNLNAGKVEVDSGCASRLPESSTSTPPRSLSAWQNMLPAADVAVKQLIITPWQTWAGSLQLDLHGQRQKILYQGKNVSLQAVLQGQQLNVSSLSLNLPGVPQPVNIAGTLVLPLIPDSLPATGSLSAGLSLQGIPAPLVAKLSWQQDQGELVVTQQSAPSPLVTLPWRVSAEHIRIQQGQWRWPYAAQPLSGGVDLMLEHWQQGVSATVITGRLNMLTQGRGGKGNVVLSLGPGKLDWINSHLPFRLTGDGKMDRLLFFVGLPGEVQGPLLDPRLSLKSGSLLRMRGRLLSTLEVDEARWPLSGVAVSSAGINGRLQAILTAHDPTMGRFRLHLDGRATNFWPDQGQWLWRYWGEGLMAPLAARWDVKGHGRWQDRLIELKSLSTGFDRINYGSISVHAPRLKLAQPIRWQRDPEHAAFSGVLRLDAQQTSFSSGGYLPPATLTLRLKGQNPASFLYDGTLEAKPIGPVRVTGRWDGERLRGQAWWPQQPLSVFQPLLSDDLKMKIHSGTLRAQVAFSAAVDQGFEAGGHWVVKHGSLWMTDNQFNGIDFSLPFRLKNHQWYLGTRGPVSLRIKEITNQFALQNITADLQGWYPWQAEQPLRLSNVGVDVLDGKMTLDSLQMPQTRAATLRLTNISLSELITAIRPRQIALSGRINAALPLWLNDSRWLVRGGWIANNGPLTVRLDKDFADALSENNLAAGAAMDWLRYMEISRSQATLDIDNLGQMTLKAQVNGNSRFSDKNQRVSLNYTQQENLFQLWRSLRFGDNLQSWLEQHATLPTQKENTNETH